MSPAQRTVGSRKKTPQLRSEDLTAASAEAPSSVQVDGGYYALKGFLYQFDKTLLEALANPTSTIHFENQQDIDYDEFVLQVKHKETQDFSPGKIRRPVEDLLRFSHDYPTKQIVLYCHFRDKTPGDWKLTSADLNSIIGDEAKAQFPTISRSDFLARFTIRFSTDFEGQFTETIAKIREEFSIADEDTAIVYHSIFRSRLLDRSVLPTAERRVSLTDLREFLYDAESTIFFSAYSNYLERERYSKLIKKRYFTANRPNLDNFQRLFVIDCEGSAPLPSLSRIAARISEKYFRRGKSPQPYLCFRNLPTNLMNDLKRNLINEGTHFFDGTHFDGDVLRIRELAEEPSVQREYVLRVAAVEKISELLERASIKEVFQFFVRDPYPLTTSAVHVRIQIELAEQVLEMIA